MQTIGSYELKTHLFEVLDAVAWPDGDCDPSWKTDCQNRSGGLLSP